MVQCRGTLSLNPRLYESNLFTFIVSVGKQKEKKCLNLTMASCFAACLFGTVGNSVIALCNCPPLQLYTLSRVVFCISLKGTFLEDVRGAESLSHFPRVVAPSRSGKENLALTRTPGC